MSLSNGFTIVELIVTIVVIAILATLIVLTYVGIQQKAIVASINNDLNSAVKTLKLFQVDNDSFPTDVNSCPTPTTGNLCLKSSPGNTYLFESTNTIPQTFCLAVRNGNTKYHITETSKPETGVCAFAFAASLTAIAASPFAINLSWGVVANVSSYTIEKSTDPSFSTPDPNPTTIIIDDDNPDQTTTQSTGLSPNTTYYYRIKATIIGNDTSEWSATASDTTNQLFNLNLSAGTGGTVNQSGTSPYNPNSTPTITATPSTYYSFTSWTGDDGCSSAELASHTITMTANKSCTANFTPTNIDAPTSPTVSNAPHSTDPAKTTYSWPATSCPVGHTARYQYQFTINTTPTPYESALTATASTSVDFTTSTENLTYTVAVQAQCYNTATTSSWSAVGSSGYYRPYTLTLIAGSGGTVSGAGAYSAGSTPTITATPNANYVFNSWSGTNCSGIASHAVPAMSDNMTCTASFIATYTLTLTAGTGGTVSGAGTYNTGTTPNMTANSSYKFVSWTGSTGCSGIASHTITMNENKSCTASFDTNWIAGIVATTMVGKYVYRMDTSTTKQWKNSLTYCVGPQCVLKVLVADNLVDFTNYPARDSCKTLGGRIPNYNELTDIYSYQTQYGSNFQVNGDYWASQEDSLEGSYFKHFESGNFGITYKTSSFNVRCVAD